MLQKLAAIIANTFIETVRQPVFGVLLWVFVGWVALVSPALASFTLTSGYDKKVMQDVSLSTLLLYGLLCSVFSASGVITREIESFTVLTVISKPVSRPLFIFGKYLGVCGALLVGFYILGLTLLMTVRHGTMETAADRFDQPVLVFSMLALLISLTAATFGNYVYGWHFSAALLGWVVPLGSVALGLVLFIDPKWKFQSPLTDFGDLQVFYALVLVFCGTLILAAFAVALSTRFSQVITLTCCFAIYVLGLLSDYYFGRHAGEALIYQVVAGILPNFQFFWVGDALTQDLMVQLPHVLAVALYAQLYSLAVLCIGVTLFQTREVG